MIKKHVAEAVRKAAEAQEGGAAGVVSHTSGVQTASTFVGGNITGITKAQSAVIFDAISEGPIEGLKHQGASIKLNGDRAYSLGSANSHGVSSSTNASYNATTGVITDHNTPGFMKNATAAEGTRKVLIVGGSKAGVANTTAGSKTIISSNLSFVDADVPEFDQVVPKIRITGAGLDGADYAATITRVINTTAVEVNFAPSKNTTNAVATLDLKKTISSYDSANNTVTVESPSGRDINNGSVIMSTPSDASDFVPAAKYESFGWAFRTGNANEEEGQTYINTPAGVGSAGLSFQVNAGDLNQLAGTGYPSLSSLGMNIDGSSPSPTGSQVITTATQMGVSDPGEVDLIKVTVNFPQGVSVTKTKDGAVRESGVENRIKFEYSRDGGSNYTSVVVVGRSSISGSASLYEERTGLYKYDTQGGTVRAKTSQPFNYVYAFDVTQFQPFDDYRIVVERVSPDTGAKRDTWTNSTSAKVTAIENIITDKLIYPYTAIGSVIVAASEFSSIPARAYEIRGMKVKVPTNYFPKDEKTATGARRTTAAYTRNVTTGADTSAYVDWDGNFRGDKKVFTGPAHPNYEPVYTNNPVWIFMDLLTNPRYGLGKHIDPDFDFNQIDKYTLYNLAKYCDELVPDGKGGTEPRFTCNAYISKQDNAIKVIKNFATTMRAMLLWHNGHVTLGANIQKGAVYTFNKTNVVDGVFSYAGSSERTKSNQIKVTWNNPDNNYKQEVAVVEDTDEIAKTGKIKTKSVTAFGCTSEGQAIRYGKWHLFSGKLEKEIVSFTTGLTGGMLQPGDVINISDPDREGVVTSGRVTSTSSSTTTNIKLDRDLSSYLNQTASYKLHLVYPKGGAYLSQPTATINSTTYYQGDLVLLDESGSAIDTLVKASNCKDDSGNVVVLTWNEDVRVETQQITSYDTTSVTVSTAFSEAPDAEVIYTISGEEEDGTDLLGSLKTYMITSVKEDTDDMTFNINAAEYDVTKFDMVDRGYVLQPEDDFFRPRSTIDVPTPTNLVLSVIPNTTDSSEGDDTGKRQGVEVLAQWTAPKSTRENEEGDPVDDVYEHLSHYEVQHNIGAKDIGYRKDRLITIDGDGTSHTIQNVFPKTRGRFRIRTVNTNGHRSDWVQRTITISGRHIMMGDNIESGGMNGGIMRGGILTTPMNIESSNGTVTFASNTYVFQPPVEVDPITVTSANTAFTTQTFPGMSDGDVAYLLFDYDGALDRGNTRSDPLRPIIVSTDSTATDADGNKLNFEYVKRLGQSGEDFTQITGTVTISANSPEVIGSSTAFLDEFQPGDLIIIDDAGTTRHIATIGEVDSNTGLTISSTSTRAYSGVNVYRQALRVDNSKDTVIARVTKSGSTYSLQPFTNKQTIDDPNEFADNVVTNAVIAANAVDGVSIQANSIGTAQIEANAIDSSHISANSIGAVAISANAIGSSEVSANSIGSASIIANSIDSSHVSANSIGAANIIAGEIDSSHIAANAIGSVSIEANAITSSEIASNAIGTVAIQANSITSTQLTANAVQAFTVTANSITAVELAANSVGSSAIAANSIASIEIQGNAIGSSEISANAVNGTIIAGNSVSGTQIAANSINGIILSSGAVDSAAKLADNIVVNSKIAANAVDTAQLLTGAVETLQIAADAITNAKIAANAVNTSEIVSDAITGDLIAANAVATAQIKSNSITSAAIVAGAIGSSEMSANSIGTANIIAGAIDSSHVSANSIGTTAIVSGAIDSSHISANSIGSTAIVAGAIGSSEISANSIGTTAIVSGAIDSSHVSANSIDTNQIVSGAIDSSHIQANSINSNMIVAGTINSSHIAANSITAAAVVAGSITNSEIQGNTINSAVIQAGAVNTPQIAGNAITSAKIAAGAVDTAEIAANAITNAKIAAGTIGNAEISSTAGIGFAKISVADGDIDFAKISVANGDIENAMINAVGTDKLTGTINTAQIAAGAITTAKIGANQITSAKIAADQIETAMIKANAITSAKIAAGQIDTAEISANAITNAKISSTDNMTITLTGGSAGGWAITANELASTNASGGGNNAYTTAGIKLGNTGFISSKNFFINTDGDASFKGTIEGNNVDISGTLTTANIQLASVGANVSGTSIGQYTYTNALNYRLIGTIGTGAGVYVGNVVGIGPGGTNHVKTIHFHVSDNTMNTSTVNADVALATNGTAGGSFDMRLQTNIDNLIPESRLFASGSSVRTHFSLPVTFKYEGTGTVKLYMYAQADTGPDYPGYIDYRFVKLGTTDPIFSFSNLTGASTSTTYYANTQVTGGFQGTKTVSISGGSAQFKIDNGSFGTSNQQIANGSYINVQMTSSSSNLSLVSTTVDIGGVSKLWTITTGGTGGGTGGGGGGSGGGILVSFLYGTELTLSDGTKKAVQDIEVGDVLKAFSDSVLNSPTATSGTLANATLATATVEGITVGEVSSFYRVNERIHVTAPHKFLILRNDTYSWIEAQNLQIGDYMVTSGLSLEKIQTVQQFNNDATVYTFDTESLDTYIAEDVVVYDAEI